MMSRKKKWKVPVILILLGLLFGLLFFVQSQFAIMSDYQPYDPLLNLGTYDTNKWILNQPSTCSYWVAGYPRHWWDLQISGGRAWLCGTAEPSDRNKHKLGDAELGRGVIAKIGGFALQGAGHYVKTKNDLRGLDFKFEYEGHIKSAFAPGALNPDCCNGCGSCVDCGDGDPYRSSRDVNVCYGYDEYYLNAGCQGDNCPRIKITMPDCTIQTRSANHGVVELVSSKINDSNVDVLLNGLEYCNIKLEDNEELFVKIEQTADYYHSYAWSEGWITIQNIEYRNRFNCEVPPGYGVGFETYTAGEVISYQGFLEPNPRLCLALSPIVTDENTRASGTLPELLPLLLEGGTYTVPDGQTITILYIFKTELDCGDDYVDVENNVCERIPVVNFCSGIFDPGPPATCIEFADIRTEYNCDGTIDMSQDPPICVVTLPPSVISLPPTIVEGGVLTNFCRVGDGLNSKTGLCEDSQGGTYQPYTSAQEACEKSGGEYELVNERNICYFGISTKDSQKVEEYVEDLGLAANEHAQDKNVDYSGLIKVDYVGDEPELLGVKEPISGSTLIVIILLIAILLIAIIFVAKK